MIAGGLRSRGGWLRFVPRALAATLCFSALASCERTYESATALVVSVKTDLAIGTELTNVTYRVFPTDADPEVDPPTAEFTAGAETLDRPFVIEKRYAQELLLSVEGTRGRGSDAVVVLVHRIRARFQNGKTLALRVFLARTCLERFCSFIGLTCYGEPRGAIAAGECEAIAGPDDLEEVTMPGDESKWVPMPGPPLDGGLGPDLPDPSFPDPSFPGPGWFGPSLDGGLCEPSWPESCGFFPP